MARGSMFRVAKIIQYMHFKTASPWTFGNVDFVELISGPYVILLQSLPKILAQ